MKDPLLLSFTSLKKILVQGDYDVVLTNHCLEHSDKQINRKLDATVKGYIVPDEYTIYINKKIAINDRVVTLIHELIHELKPRWSEGRVEREANKMFRHLTVPQLGFLQFFVMEPKEDLNFMAA